MAEQMKCHYEVLGVPRDVSNEDLKKAHRKLALKWHPDKNPDNIEECTKQFRLIQQSYEVLSDPQERAWYDRHREEILRGGLGHGDKYEDSFIDVFQYFTSSCFKGFGDDKEGFYAVYDEVFKTVAEEDKPFMEDEDIPGYEFGNSTSVYEEVVKPFYDFWDSYCTAKSYVWVDKYDTREAPDRRVRRLMEAENKKLRDAAKKERNDQIRALAKFVKKRDKRVQEYKKKLEQRAEEIAKKTKEQRQRQLEESRKNLENYKEAAWSAAHEDHYKDLEASYADLSDGGDIEGDIENEEEEDLYDNLFCVICNKAFKSDKAFMNHEKSKKHKDMVALVRAHMEEGDEQFVDGVNEEGMDGQNGDLGENEPDDQGQQKLSKKQKKKRKQQKNIQQADEIDSLVTDTSKITVHDNSENTGTQKTKSKRERRKEKKNRQLDSSDEEDPYEEMDKTEVTKTDNIEETENTNEADCCDRLTEPIDSDVTKDTEDDISGLKLGEDIQTDITGDTGDTDDIMANKKKRKQNKSEPDPNQKQGRCGVCHAEFPSRSKLFGHIKETGHAMIKGTPAVEEKQGKKNKKKKR